MPRQPEEKFQGLLAISFNEGKMKDQIQERGTLSLFVSTAIVKLLSDINSVLLVDNQWPRRKSSCNAEKWLCYSRLSGAAVADDHGPPLGLFDLDMQGLT